ncbi:hypothetical protein HYH03_009042 [Edaphochlamys debaryana]|uniref:Uncharacterized protein n=1 Tax=Edaphochlamys debaryana TaxID=47281 RepID=A0A836BXD5_9CHLO|nr:hypothetical protein HYH03_009042 [Edaphochlamys debaryana]|eukprot:KAG2492626.1 hypothetical protein HYH03_009042 [Edaphochlamys debaryana]
MMQTTKAAGTKGSTRREAFGAVRAAARVTHLRCRSVVVRASASGLPGDAQAWTTRRSALLSLLSAPAAAALLLSPGRALAADPAVQDAIVILMDARSTLRTIQSIAATPLDSEERFRARAFWPAYAKRLRAVAGAAPVAGAAALGVSDKAEAMGVPFGGKAEGAGLVDPVFVSLGRVLTISGRTITAEAQAEPGPAKAAEEAVEGVLSKVPQPLLDAAQAFRVERAKAAGVA